MKSKKSSIPNNLLPPGFKDDVSDQASVEHKYKNLIINLFQNNGYMLVKTPLIEFAKKENFENLFIIKNKKKEKELTIRDDITMQISRISSSRLSKYIRPLKLCYYGEVVRKKGSILRPERQFLQVGAECIGEKSYFADVEMIELAYNALKLVGVKNISIELTSRIFMDKIYEKIKSKDILKKIKNLIRKKDFDSVFNDIKKNNHNYLKNVFLCTGNFKNKIKFLQKLSIDEANDIEIKNLIKIYKLFEKKYKESSIIMDLTEVEDKNYHNGIRFTIFSENIRGEIARGGRYISNNNKTKESSTGFTFYMDTILRASSTIENTKKILIPFKTSSDIKKILIKKNFIIETFFGNVKNIKKIAEEKNFKFYLKNKEIQKLIK